MSPFACHSSNIPTTVVIAFYPSNPHNVVLFFSLSCKKTISGFQFLINVFTDFSLIVNLSLSAGSKIFMHQYFNQRWISSVVQKVVLLLLSYIERTSQSSSNMANKNASGLICIFAFKISCICVYICIQYLLALPHSTMYDKRTFMVLTFPTPT